MVWHHTVLCCIAMLSYNYTTGKYRLFFFCYMTGWCALLYGAMLYYITLHCSIGLLCQGLLNYAVVLCMLIIICMLHDLMCFVCVIYKLCCGELDSIYVYIYTDIGIGHIELVRKRLPRGRFLWYLLHEADISFLRFVSFHLCLACYTLL